MSDPGRVWFRWIAAAGEACIFLASVAFLVTVDPRALTASLSRIIRKALIR